jgi:hypothetical protein
VASLKLLRRPSAAAAEYQYQNGKPEFAGACLSDVMDDYTRVLGVLLTDSLTGAQLQDRKAKLIRPKRLLDGLRTPIRNEAT